MTRSTIWAPPTTNWPAPSARRSRGTLRQQVLLGFLARERIYNTPHFHERLEGQARANLLRATAVERRP